MDTQAIYRIFVEEKRNLGSPVPRYHAVFRPAGSDLNFWDLSMFSGFVEGRTIQLCFQKERYQPPLTEKAASCK
jgi:hypothetical protein